MDSLMPTAICVEALSVLTHGPTVLWQPGGLCDLFEPLGSSYSYSCTAVQLYSYYMYM